jgi:hypothetical protein
MSIFDAIFQLMSSHKYDQAEEAIHDLLDDGEHELQLFVSLARCQLAQEKFEEALQNYNHLLHHSDELNYISAIEAALVLDKTSDAMNFCTLGAPEFSGNPQFHFLTALVQYKHGNIKAAGIELTRAIQLDLEWDDEDSIDFVTQQILPIHEFHDFEQLYLDCQELGQEESGAAQNRWFSLNMPTWDLLKASTPERQLERAIELANLLSPHFDETYLQNGKSELWRIVNDMNKNGENEAFVEKARTSIRESNFVETAKLILALELEHLGQFASFFGLASEEITKLNLQGLLGLLPMRLAVGVVFLYSASHSDETLPGYDPEKFSEDIFAGLIAACFVSFYQQVDTFRPKEGAKNN